MKGTVLVTGATAGFGAACARRFAAEGWRVVITGRRQERLDALAAELAPAPVHALRFDVREREAIDAALATLPEDFRAIDLLINNAGLALGLESAQECDLCDWETMVDTNIKGLLYMTRAIVPGMIERGRGHIVNLGSIAGTYPYPGGNVYGATKAFVKQFSRNLRADLLGTPVRVTNIEPGLAESEFSVVRFKGDADKAAKVYENVSPLTPEDIADTIFWAASRPAHVNINAIELMPVQQAFSPLAVHRGS
ncbi:NADP-dependent 3-hydroxy acid dehydrogenase YdfG [Desulfobaculum xiamenense]|uniref:NADP-dependent 3-hydroxy acid dehydrogenase YdfG n=1 Tax=Desulfobaculum xiamenense TaxID=995050 RepID=A0A846QIN4_9BACT|nr:SDR family oxidoreductase [Desulfobaculum xiamenense]NJB68726.1 NADP-dependent 3-hydroxy acid dehydrogenase YdfG [Desulfobaculum xiamenense]